MLDIVDVWLNTNCGERRHVRRVEKLHGEKVEVVFTNGVFDILHRGHLELFKYAKSLGDELVVGIDSDQKVKKDKGLGRPYNCLEDRVEMIKALRMVDRVVVFESRSELERLIKEFNPAVLVVGSDWEGKTVVGEEYATEIKYFKRIGNYSTTNILKDN